MVFFYLFIYLFFIFKERIFLLLYGVNGANSTTKYTFCYIDNVKLLKCYF